MTNICEECGKGISDAERGRPRRFCKECGRNRKLKKDAERIKQKRLIEKAQKIKTIEDVRSLFAAYVKSNPLPPEGIDIRRILSLINPIRAGSARESPYYQTPEKYVERREFSEREIVKIFRREMERLLEQ